MKTEELLNEREKTHGSFQQVGDISARLKFILRENYSSGLKNRQKEALEAICVKIARILSGDPGFEDHWDDIAGYAKLGSDPNANFKKIRCMESRRMCDELLQKHMNYIQRWKEERRLKILKILTDDEEI